jgi:hypothetical protein
MPSSARKNSFDRGEDQDRPEDVHHPVEVGEQRGAGEDEDRAHAERAEHAPEEHTVLVCGRHREVREDRVEDEQVVDRERLLDHVAGQELESALGTKPLRDERREAQCERHPDRAPDAGLLRRDLVRIAMEHAEIQREQRQHEDHEARHRAGVPTLSMCFPQACG